MFNSLVSLDHKLFSFIYSLPHPFLLVLIMEIFSLIGHFGIVWLVIGFFQKKLKPVLFALILVFLIVDIFLKFTIARPRPFPSTFDNFFPWESFSFPSGHAATATAAVYVLLQRSKIKNQRSKPQLKNKRSELQTTNYKLFLWFLAFFISFSRIYLGRHYPMDIIAGGIIGRMIGWIVSKQRL